MSFHTATYAPPISDGICAQRIMVAASQMVSQAGSLIDDWTKDVSRGPGGKQGVVDALVAQGGTTAQDVVDLMAATVAIWNDNRPFDQHGVQAAVKVAPIVQGDLP